MKILVAVKRVVDAKIKVRPLRVDNHMYIPEVGIRAGLEFSAEHVYWFDPETTKRIRL